MINTACLMAGRVDTNDPIVRRGVGIPRGLTTPLSRNETGFVISLTGHANLRGYWTSDNMSEYSFRSVTRNQGGVSARVYVGHR